MKIHDKAPDKTKPSSAFFAFSFGGVIIISFSGLIIPYNNFGLEISKTIISSGALDFLDYFSFYHGLKSIPATEQACKYMYVMNGFSIILSLIFCASYSFIALRPSEMTDESKRVLVKLFILHLSFFALSIAMIAFYLYDPKMCIVTYSNHRVRKIPFASSVFLFVFLYTTLSFPAFIVSITRRSSQN